jgi:hypothetical protein
MSLPSFHFRLKYSLIPLVFILGCFIVLILQVGCEYNIEGDYFRDITKPDTNRFISMELDPADSAYLLTAPAVFHYDLNTFGLKIYNVKVFVEKILVFEGSTAENTFSINTDSYYPGDYTLSLVVTTNTNSLSLADLVGYEGLVFMRTWRVHIDSRAPNSVNLTTIFNDKGMLRVEWQPYQRLNFQQYRIWARYTGSDLTTYQSLVGEVDDQMQTWYYDTTYIGGKVSYWIEVMAHNEFAAGDTMEFESKGTQLQLAWQKGDSALFYWHPEFPGSTYSYRISVYTEAYNNPWENIYYTTDPNDTFFVAKKLRFGQVMNYKLECIPKKTLITYQSPYSTVNILKLKTGTVMPVFNKIFRSQYESAVYLGTESKILKFNIDDNEITDQLSGIVSHKWIATPDGKHIYSWNDAGVVQYNTDNFTETGRYPYRSYFYTLYNSNAVISNMGTMVVYDTGGYGLFDFNQDDFIFSDKQLIYGAGTLSAMGDYTCLIRETDAPLPDLVIFKVTQAGFVEDNVLPHGRFILVKWIDNEESRLLIIEDGEFATPALPNQYIVNIYDPVTRTISTKFEIKAFDEIVGVDPVSQSLAVWHKNRGANTGNTLELYNYQTGALTGWINLSPWVDNLYFTNATVFSPDGIYLKMDEIE